MFGHTSSRFWVIEGAIPNNLFRSRTDGLFSQSRYNDMPLDYFYGVMHKCTTINVKILVIMVKKRDSCIYQKENMVAPITKKLRKFLYDHTESWIKRI